ncbi:hypothetical protein LTR05_001125 [Lithohypha guttulata]|uniref:Uncharacterized protein n=1 Tax=Lithohypha guttulata TaxID=1690604 RepID=A0AAN7YER8_9EURO|nr:hypothetical protein LTR05_001125 [Lithohypha guttulata]
MGSIDVSKPYSVPEEARKVLDEGIFQNPKIARLLPDGVSDFASKITFTGNNVPSIPINWRFAESAASLKALEACIVAELVKRKYGVELSGAKINTDHASLFFMSTLIWQFKDADGPTSIFDSAKTVHKFIPNYDLHRQQGSLHRSAATNIYRTKDGRYFHLHGSMNPDPTLDSVNLPHDRDASNWDEAIEPFVEKLSQIDSAEMQKLASDEYKQAGVICETVESFKQTEHGKANAHVALFEVHDVPNANQKPCWWPETSQTSAQRPLAGLKVVDLTRVIAAPAVTRGLAELGASVMRVTSPNICDYSALHIDLNWGKWNCSIDLKSEEGKKQLSDLIKDADVVVQGYRPDVLDKYGFSQQGIIDMVKDRPRGIISARENCYGWNGPWYYRSGWQQISDACIGISESFGRAMGLQNGEAVTPVFPNSDYMTGTAGVCGVLTALMRRAEKGGSYKADLSLNYYNQWLAESCGEYPTDVWEDVWQRNGRRVFRSTDNMVQLIPAYIKMIKDNSDKIVFNPSFFEERESKAIENCPPIRAVKPIIDFDGQVKLGYNVGTRGNGRDKPHWPSDLMVEVVS